jgi:hypothetical protein
MTKSIPLTKGRFALVDDADYEWLNQKKWCLKSVGSKEYAAANFWNGKGNVVTMHRYILGKACEGKMVDHKDGNGLNNQRSNLRPCTHSENMRNVKKPSVNTFPYKGVRPQGRGWRADMSCNNKTIYLGTFDGVEEAARAYDKKAKELFGEFARLNFPD